MTLFKRGFLAVLFIMSVVFLSTSPARAECVTPLECYETAIDELQKTKKALSSELDIVANNKSSIEALVAKIKQLETDLAKLEEKGLSLANRVTEAEYLPRRMEQLRVSPQIQAQAACTALSGHSGSYISAVPRHCTDSTPSCNEICTTVGGRSDHGGIRDKAKTHKTVGAIHIYENTPSDNTNRTGLVTYIYQQDSWDNRFCGPNFCCCESR